MTTILNKSYFVKVSTQGERGQNCPKFCPRGLYTVQQPYLDRIADGSLTTVYSFSNPYNMIPKNCMFLLEWIPK